MDILEVTPQDINFGRLALYHRSRKFARKKFAYQLKKKFWDFYSLKLRVLEYRQTFFDYFFDVKFSDKTPASEFLKATNR